MDLILTLFALLIPLVLLTLGILENKALLIYLGAILMVVVGVFMLASPAQIFYVDAVNITKTVTANSSLEFMQYSYNNRVIDPNMNLGVSVLAIFFGIGALYLTIIGQLKHGQDD